MSKTIPTLDEQYQGALDELLSHLRAASAAQARAEGIEGDAHMADIGRSLQRRWQGPPLAEVVYRMEREQKEVTR